MSLAARNGTRAAIARKVQGLRKARHWTQSKLARDLGLSQSRLSEIESGKGSFTAEQFISILGLFNAPVDQFLPRKRDPGTELQNALARLGASHLWEDSETPPSDRLTDVGSVITETLTEPESPRHIVALAPVLVVNIDRVRLRRLYGHFVEIGLGQRFAWVLDNTLEAVRREAPRSTGRQWRFRYRRTELILSEFIASLPSASADQSEDILDREIASKKTYAELHELASPISKRWRVVTRIQPDDFAAALKDCRDGD